LPFVVLFACAALLAGAEVVSGQTITGTLAFDLNAENPLYLRAFEMPAGASLERVRVYVADSHWPPSSVRILGADELGYPLQEGALELRIPGIRSDGSWVDLKLDPGSDPPEGRFWVCVAFESGRSDNLEDAAMGPAIGYAQVAEGTCLGQLVSCDGGLSYERLDCRSRLGIEATLTLEGVEIMARAGGAPDRPVPNGYVEAFPNPFNPQTTIRFWLEKAGDVRLRLFDARGRQVLALLHESFPAGWHSLEWDGRDEAGVACSSGVYFVRLELGSSGRGSTLRLVLLR